MPVKVIVTDIEGTTTSISFVKDKLFPYAVEHVQAYLTENWTNADVKGAVKELRDQFTEDETNKVEGAVAISDGEGKEEAEQIAEIVANVKWQISIDRKTTALKKLQGLIWAKGYESGAIKGHVYEDVPKAFERWTTDNIKIYIYSSGSVAAQKMLFANSEHGDLTPKISGYFDTNIGAKQQTSSYEKIVKEVGCESIDILFLTDIVNEAAAAKEAGIKVALLVRDGNGPLTDEEKAEYQLFSSFDEINLEFVIGKRKLDEILTTETNAVKIPKLSDDESVITSEADTESVTDTNGRTDNINDTKMDTHVGNGDETETTKTDELKKTEDIPITQKCDYKHKTDNLEVDVGEKDSKPLIEVDEVTKINEALPMDVVDDKSSDAKKTEDIEMEMAPIVKEVIPEPTSDVMEVVEPTADITSDVESKPAAEPVSAIPDVPADNPIGETEVSEKVLKDETVNGSNEITTDVPLKQNGDHADGIVEKESEKIEATSQKAENDEQIKINVGSESNDTNQPKEVETEKIEKDDKVAASENGVQETEEVENKENIPVEIKEKENIIEIPVHIDADQSAQKPSIVSATNGNGVPPKDDLSEVAAAATNSNKEKMSRIELIIEEKNNDNGQLTETTTHIVKEIIVKNNVCESENVEILPENV